MGIFDSIGKFIDKRKFISIHKKLDKSYYTLISKILAKTGNIKEQATLLKQKDEILSEIDSIISQYDTIILHIKDTYEREDE